MKAGVKEAIQVLDTRRRWEYQRRPGSQVATADCQTAACPGKHSAACEELQPDNKLLFSLTTSQQQAKAASSAMCVSQSI